MSLKLFALTHARLLFETPNDLKHPKLVVCEWAIRGPLRTIASFERA